MLALEKGAYLGQVLGLSHADHFLAGVTSYRPDDGTDLTHYHENTHLSFVLCGGGVEKRRSAEFERRAGQIMFFHAGEVHQCFTDSFPTRKVNVELEARFLRDNGLSESAANVSVVGNPNSKFIMLKVYRELLVADDYSPCSMTMLLLEMFSATQRVTSSKPYPLWVKIVKDLANDQWSERLSLGDLSKATGLHPVTISKSFPTYFFCTFGEYMRRIKVERAIQLIRTSPTSLTELAHKCGFFDHSHFTRTFKRLTGFLPNVYAKL